MVNRVSAKLHCFTYFIFLCAKQLPFNLNSKSYGIKIHQSDASPETVSAAARLFEKGLIDHIDGGYLTDLGVETAEHAQILLQILLVVARRGVVDSR